eukprot:12157324-Ditylum_brightwellii.AAC.1
MEAELTIYCIQHWSSKVAVIEESVWGVCLGSGDVFVVSQVDTTQTTPKNKCQPVCCCMI